MSESEPVLLSDRDVYPDEDYIFSIIGETKELWQIIMSYMSENFEGSDGKWNFYNDGKRWLYKMVYKKKTVFWATILPSAFRITFYLGNKAEQVIDTIDLPQSIKDDFGTAKRYGLIRPVTILVNDSDSTANVLKMISIKAKLK